MFFSKINFDIITVEKLKVKHIEIKCNNFSLSDDKIF